MAAFLVVASLSAGCAVENSDVGLEHRLFVEEAVEPVNAVPASETIFENTEADAVVEQPSDSIPDGSQSEPEPEAEKEPESASGPVLDINQSGEIFYWSASAREIYAYNVRTGAKRQVTNNDFDEYLAELSPDGSLITFVDSADGDEWADIYGYLWQVNSNGRHATRLPEASDHVTSAHWSHDGSELVVTALGEIGYRGYLDRFANLGFDEGLFVDSFVTDHAFSHDDRYFAFMGQYGDGFGLHTVTFPEHEVTQLTQPGWHDDPFSWSPLEHTIAFLTQREVRSISVEGGEPTVLASFEKTAGMRGIRWSHDGEHIAFITEYQHEPNQLHVMRADGSDLRTLTSGNSNVVGLEWAPDSSMLVVETSAGDVYNDREKQIYVMNLDGEIFSPELVGYLIGWR